MTALQGAFAFAEVDDVAVRVGHNLDFDMARGGDEAFEEQGVVAEGARGFAAGSDQRLGELARFEDRVHAFSSAPG